MKITNFFQILAVMLFCTNISFAQDFNEDSYYRLTTKWQGEGMSLDIINDGKNITPTLAKSGIYSGQAWKIKKVGDDLYTLTTAWRGPELKLDCIQGPNQNSPVLNKTESSGSAWKITSLGGGYYKITNLWLSDRSLDIINDGKNNKIQVAKTGNFTGQMWKITEIPNSSKNHLNAGETLQAGESLVSENGAFILKMQATDGNLCVYKYKRGKEGGFVWGSMQYGFKNGKLVMQTDGNLVVYDGKNVAKWSSQTHPYFDDKFRTSTYKPVKLVLENDGSLKLYTAANRVVWSSSKSKSESAEAPQVQVNAHTKCYVAMIDTKTINDESGWWGQWHEIKRAKTYKESPCTFSGLKPSTYVLVVYNPAATGDSDGVVLDQVTIKKDSKLSYDFKMKDFKDWNCLSCPWLYAFDGKEYIKLTEVIQDVVGEQNCQTTSHQISTQYVVGEKLKIRIQEEKEETSYLDRISLTVDGKKIIPVKKELTEEDKDYLILEKGEFVDLEFDLSGYGSEDHEIILECNGFYTPRKEFLKSIFNDYLYKK